MGERVLIDRMCGYARRHNRSRTDWGHWRSLRRVLKCHRLLEEMGNCVEISGVAPIRWLKVNGKEVYRYDD